MARLVAVALFLLNLFAGLPGGSLAAQQTVSLIAPSVPGRLLIVTPPGWVASSIALEAGGSPVMTLSDPESSVAASYSLFASHAAEPTAESCREEALAALVARLTTDVKLRDRQTAARPGPDGASLATASLVLASADAAAPDAADQTEFYAFAAGAKVCAELHLSKAPAGPLDDSVLTAPVGLFHFEPAYAPTADDFAGLGAVFAEQVNDHLAAALYYERALQALPGGDDPSVVAARRRYTNEITTAYVLAQDHARARQADQAALATDPNYALYYYELACLDAEDHNAIDARFHLQQAYEHRAGLPAGEQLPNPRTDESFLKLKSDRPFWRFVEHVH